MVAADEPRLRVMVDANILVAGTGWPRFPYEVLQHAVKHDFQLVLSPFIVEEARRHVARMLPTRMAHLERFLELSSYEHVADPAIEDVKRNAELVRDEKDVPVALSAIQAQVDYLITQDRDFTDTDATTQKLHRALKVLLPATFLRLHMGWSSEQLEAIRNRSWVDMDQDS